MGDQNTVADEVLERGQHVGDRRGARAHIVGDAVKPDRRLGDWHAGMDQAFERGLPVDAPAGDAHPGNGDDLIPFRRLKARGLRVEDDEGQVLQAFAAQFLEMHGRIQLVEIVKFGPRRQGVLIKLAGPQLAIQQRPDQTEDESQHRRPDAPGESHPGQITAAEMPRDGRRHAKRRPTRQAERPSGQPPDAHGANEFETIHRNRSLPTQFSNHPTTPSPRQDCVMSRCQPRHDPLNSAQT